MPESVSTTRARLTDVNVPDDPDGVVVVLHGGAARRGSMMDSPAQLSVVRMIPVARRLAARSPRLAVFRLLNSARGWDTSHTPVDDAAWALSQLRDRFGPRPAALVGHSLGGRAALLAAGEPDVRAVVALNPWVYDSDRPRGDIADVQFLIVHGTRDRIASPARSLTVARALERRAAVHYLPVEGGKHAMLRHGREYENDAAAFVATTMTGADPTSRLAAALGAPLPM